MVRARSIWVMNRDGSGQRRLTTRGEAIAPAWSPDGVTIYFSRFVLKKDEHGGFVGYAWAIFRMRADGGDVRQLTRPVPSDHGTCHEGAAPSPDGTLIAFAVVDDCDHGYDASLAAVDTDGRRVDLGRFAGSDSAFDPAWSPSGSALAFASIDEWGAGDGIEVAAEDASRGRRVYRRGPASGPAWSPDGALLAFSTNGGVWIVRPGLSPPRRVLRTGVWRSDPAWLPPVVR